MLQRTLPAGFIAPCLPIKTTKLPHGGQWLHEIKHDGFERRSRTLTTSIERMRSNNFSAAWRCLAYAVPAAPSPLVCSLTLCGVSTGSATRRQVPGPASPVTRPGVRIERAETIDPDTVARHCSNEVKPQSIPLWPVP
jgi:hypothetical protein